MHQLPISLDLRTRTVLELPSVPFGHRLPRAAELGTGLPPRHNQRL